jgi:hypothetical protein
VKGRDGIGDSRAAATMAPVVCCCVQLLVSLLLDTGVACELGTAQGRIP